ncbi:MAG: 50S ribosomal protein L30 [bacterium]|nr:50S ribosomal protein L30 [bacterium]
MGKLKITYVRSKIDCSKSMKKIMAALGFRKLYSVKIHHDTPAIRGMIAKVSHLVKVEEIPD